MLGADGGGAHKPQVAKDVHVFARAAGVPVNESDAAAAAGSASSGGKDVDSIAAACGTLSFDCEWDPTTPPGAIVKSTDGDSSAAAAAGEATKSKKKQALPKVWQHTRMHTPYAACMF